MSTSSVGALVAYLHVQYLMGQSYRKVYLISMIGNLQVQEFTLASQPTVPSSFNRSSLCCGCEFGNLGYPYGAEFLCGSLQCLPHPACCLLCNEAKETIQHLLVFSKGGGTIRSRVFTKSIEMIWNRSPPAADVVRHACYQGPLN